MEEQRKAKIAFIPRSYRTYDVLILRSYSRSALIPCQNSMFQCERGMSAIKRAHIVFLPCSNRAQSVAYGMSVVRMRYECGMSVVTEIALIALSGHVLSTI